MGLYSFGKGSEKQLGTIHLDLEKVLRDALASDLMDMTVVEGRRTKESQNRLFDIGKSRLRWPLGKHNVVEPAGLAKAVDVAPCVGGKVSWKYLHCVHLAGIILMAAAARGIRLRWGGNWDMDGEPVTDQDFQDLVHFELVTK